MTAPASASMAQPLRLISIATFLPAFPLCIAHGVLSHSATPAVGLAPLATSAGLSAFLLLRSHEHHRVDDDEPGASGQQEELAEEPARPSIIEFLADAILATALMVVLVFTWISAAGPADARLTMLASYATIPLLINFLIHLYLAVSAFYAGLALHALTQWLAWQVVPPDCPNCSHRLRPSPPTIPWFHRRSERSLPRWMTKLPAMPALPTLPAIRNPEWKTPAWLKGRSGGQASLFVSEEDRYRDEPENGEPANAE